MQAYFVFFFNDTATTEIYTLSLHDALPISTSCPPSGDCSSPPTRCPSPPGSPPLRASPCTCSAAGSAGSPRRRSRSEEHTSELQSRQYLVCRLLLEKKKKTYKHSFYMSTRI